MVRSKDECRMAAWAVRGATPFLLRWPPGHGAPRPGPPSHPRLHVQGRVRPYRKEPGVVHLAGRKAGTLRDGVRGNLTQYMQVAATGWGQRTADSLRCSSEAYGAGMSCQMRSSGKSRGWRVLGIVGVLVVLGSAWRLLTRGSAPSAQGRPTGTWPPPLGPSV